MLSRSYGFGLSRVNDPEDNDLTDSFHALSNTGAELEFSIVMPCLNEADTLANCLQKAHQSIARLGLSAEVIVADNGSIDGSKCHVLILTHRILLD